MARRIRHSLAVRNSFSIGVLSLLVAALADPVLAVDSSVSVRSGEARFSSPVRSARALRDEGVVKQDYDYSCGSAALATLLTYGIGDDTDEAWVLSTVFANSTPAERRILTEKGLSLLDLQRVAESRGHKAQGFRLSAEQILKLGRPVIVFIQPRGYRHFAVLKGIRGDRAYLADPSLGNVRMPLYQFLDMWADEQGNGVIFAVERRDAQWPDIAALRVPAASEGRPLEVLSARQLVELGKAYPAVHPSFLLR